MEQWQQGHSIDPQLLVNKNHPKKWLIILHHNGVRKFHGAFFDSISQVSKIPDV